MTMWHRSVAADLEVPALTESTIEQEIAFGHARSILLYVLELGRAYRLAATGNLLGDDVWLQFGRSRIRLTLNRREEVVVVRSLREERRLTWSTPLCAWVDPDGTARDLAAIAKAAVDELIVEWRAHPGQRLSPSPTREYEDEPTKG